jgi:hydroxymethylbilane synthase
LKLRDRIDELIPVELMCPAVGQGALAIETREDGGVAHQLAAKLDHAETRAAVTAERALLLVLGGGCQVPVGAHARLSGNQLHMMAVVAKPDGSRIVRGELTGSDPTAVGTALGKSLLDQGAREILDQVYLP